MTSTSADGAIVDDTSGPDGPDATGPISLDPWDRPAAREAAAARAAHDGARLRRLLASTDPAQVSFLFDIASDADDVVAMIDGAREGDDDPVVDTLRARHHVIAAWRFRGSARASQVSADQFEKFFAELHVAERLLVELCARHPSYAPAWETRLMTARGLELGPHEARRRYDRHAALAPHHYLVQSLYLQQVLPKWGGSWDAAEAFVAECAQDAPLGSPSRGLVTDVMIERWVDDGEVLADDAHVANLRRVARETVLHEDAISGPAADALHARLALLYYLADRLDDAEEHFRALGTRPSDAGWVYLESPAWRYELARAQALGLPRPTNPPGMSPGQWRLARTIAIVLNGVQGAFTRKRKR
jgi:hypothetical protein